MPPPRRRRGCFSMQYNALSSCLNSVYLSMARPATRVPSFEVYTPKASTVRPPTAAVSFCLSESKFVRPCPRFLQKADRAFTCAKSLMAITDIYGALSRVFTSNLCVWVIATDKRFQPGRATHEASLLKAVQMRVTPSPCLQVSMSCRLPEGCLYAFDGLLALLFQSCQHLSAIDIFIFPIFFYSTLSFC